MDKEGLGIMVIDDYENKVLSGGEVSVLIDGGKPRLVRENCGAVFLAPPSGVYNLTVAGERFQKQEMEIDAGEETQIGGGIMKIRLQPNRRYPLEEAVKVLRGQAECGGELHFIFISPKECYRLGRDYRAGEREIFIVSREEAFLDGSLFCLQKNDGEINEFWIEENTGEAGRFRLRYPLHDSYDKDKCLLRRVYPVVADREGYFYLPVPAGEAACGEYRYYSPLDKRAVKTGTLSGTSGETG